MRKHWLAVLGFFCACWKRALFALAAALQEARVEARAATTDISELRGNLEAVGSRLFCSAVMVTAIEPLYACRARKNKIFNSETLSHGLETVSHGYPGPKQKHRKCAGADCAGAAGAAHACLAASWSRTCASVSRLRLESALTKPPPTTFCQPTGMPTLPSPLRIRGPSLGHLDRAL